MGKLALKTALISFASVVAAALLSFACCFAFFPMTVSDAAYSLGAYGISASQAERGYKSTRSVDDLKKLTERAILAENGKLVLLYAPAFMQESGFLSIAEEENKANVVRLQDYKIYIAGSYVKYAYLAGEKITATSVAEEAAYDYNDYTVFEYLIREIIIAEDGEYASYVKGVLTAKELTGENSQAADNYIKILDTLLSGK